MKLSLGKSVTLVETSRAVMATVHEVWGESLDDLYEYIAIRVEHPWELLRLVLREGWRP